MKERAIIFNTEMVKAILDGRKTVTRRPVKPQPESIDHKKNITIPYNGSAEFLKNHIKCSLGQIGDRLYVRETFTDKYNTAYIMYKSDYPMHWDAENTEHGEEINLKADDFKWIPSIHMPKKYARIWLEITDVRVERVQDIDSYQAWDEGFRCICTQPTHSCCGNVIQFKKTWDSIYKNWSDNPWVWVIEFKRVER